MIYIRADLEDRTLYWVFTPTTPEELFFVPGEQRLRDREAVVFARVLRERGFALCDKWGTMPEVPAELGEP